MRRMTGMSAGGSEILLMLALGEEKARQAGDEDLMKAVATRSWWKLAINLLAFDTRFFGGPARRGKIGDYSTLLVDGKYG